MQDTDLLSVPYAGSWLPSEVVEVVTRFARRLNKEVAWGDIQQLLVLINQVQSRLNLSNWCKQMNTCNNSTVFGL
jgi:hypothetical protein